MNLHKDLYRASKKTAISTLEYIKKVLSLVADIVKSFATIIAGLVAGITAGISGYYEIKKIVKKERHEHKSSDSRVFGPPAPNALTSSETSAGSTLQIPDGYRVDMNTGTLAGSLLMLVILVFVKMKNNTRNTDKP
jgi:uncharacterized integral membrane protein